MRRRFHAALSTAVASWLNLACGCAGSGSILIPYVSIPARVEIGGVSAHGDVPARQPGGAVQEYDQAHMLHLRAGLNPLHCFNGLHSRNFDVGAGYLAEWLWPSGGDQLLFQGFYLEGAYFPWSAKEDSKSFRLGLMASAEVMLTGYTGNDEIGPGMSAGAYLEWTGSAASAYAKESGGGLGSSAASIGAWYGEWAIGLGVTAGYRRLFDRNFLTVFVGLSFRLPLGAGLAGVSS